MKSALKVFGPNLHGRDFAIGDLHGSIDCFQNLLREIHFDQTKDRMFSASDLVDRGTNSLECLRLMREPWFHNVLANHEQMMIEAFHGGIMGQYWIQNGGRWGLEALQQYRAKKAGQPHVITDDMADLYDLVELADELPFLITINHKSGKKFHILHAELPPRLSGEVRDVDLEDEECVRELAMTQAGDGDAFLWARSLFQDFSRMPVDKERIVKRIKMMRGGKDQFLKQFNDERSHIISGHSIVYHPLTLIGQTNIDTCAYGADDRAQGWEALTCIDLDTWTFYQATPTTFKVVEPITVNKADLD
jgi:hypothetical protein